MEEKIRLDDLVDSVVPGYMFACDQTPKRIIAYLGRFEAECLAAGASHIFLRAAGHEHCWRCGECFIKPAPYTKSKDIYFRKEIIEKFLGT